ncbi:MAG: hypothetical protein J0G32_00845 [Alphaproteobacteria bacterium]|nr:hypothetical protein [Alphaproteobacteria bacterium]OJV14120.1 MAG: hypothetical protein BGO27_01370 [Alphaproteobacteria bacterium 33-17]
MHYKKQIDVNTYIFISEFGSQRGLDFEHNNERFSANITFGSAINIERDLGKKFNRLISLDNQSLDEESIESILYHALNSDSKDYSLLKIRYLTAEMGIKTASLIATCLITIFLYPNSINKLTDICHER